MSKIRSLFLALTVVAAGFLIFTATRFSDSMYNLARGPVGALCSGVNVRAFNGICTGPGVAPTIPWVLLGWLIFLSIVFVDLLIADFYFFAKRKHLSSPAKAGESGEHKV